MKKCKFYSLCIISLGIALTGCNVIESEDASEVLQEVETIIESSEAEDKIEASNTEETYEYYLTKEELLDKIEQGYVFYMDKTFRDEAMPTVTEGNWNFYVYENNTLNVEILYSNLFEEAKTEKMTKNFFNNIKEIAVDVISPEGQNIYSFSKQGKEIRENTSIKEEIPLIPGEWNLKLTFSYFSHGEETPSNLKIAAAYANPSDKDISWLKKERLKK